MQQHAIRLPLAFDPALLMADLERTLQHGTVAQFGSYHDGSWKGISLRSEGGHALTTHTGMIPTGEPFEDTAILRDTPYFRHVLASIPCPQRAVRLLHLPPGARIEPHVDPPLTFQHGILRLHIPVVTHPDLEFVIGGVRCHWRAGELWWGNFSLVHHVYNNSPVNRVHLVMDVEINQAILKLFPAEFIEAQKKIGISFRNDDVLLTRDQLRRFECDVRVPADVFPQPALQSGATVAIRALDGQLTVTVSSPSATPPLKLRPIGADEFSFVGWSHAITLRFELANDRVANAVLTVRGLSRAFMRPESVDNPRLSHNEIQLEILQREATEPFAPAAPHEARRASPSALKV